jgi:hypothetical protein
VQNAGLANDSSLVLCSVHIIHLAGLPQIFGIEPPLYHHSIVNEILSCATVNQGFSCNHRTRMSKCNRYLQGVYCASVHSIQAHCLYPGCSGRASQKPCSVHKLSSNLVRSSSFIDHIRSRALPPLFSCSLDEEGPSYAGAGSTCASVILMVGVGGVVLPFLGHCFNIWPCAWQLKQRCSLSNVFLSSLVRNAVTVRSPC